MSKEDSERKKRKSAFDKGRKQGSTEGYEYAMNLILYVMQDKFNWNDEEIEQLHWLLESANEAIIRGNLNMRDIKQVLRDEYNIEFAYIGKRELKELERQKREKEEEEHREKTPEEIRADLLEQLKNRYSNYD